MELSCWSEIDKININKPGGTVRQLKKMAITLELNFKKYLRQKIIVVQQSVCFVFTNS